MKQKIPEPHNKKEIWFLLSLALLGGLLALFVYVPHNTGGNYVEVRINGKTMQTYPLSENRTETIRTEDGGENTFYIEKNRVTMKEANCHDKICVNTRSISKNGETIVCLPHKLVLAIITEDSAPYVPDAVVGGIP